MHTVVACEDCRSLDRERGIREAGVQIGRVVRRVPMWVALSILVSSMTPAQADAPPLRTDAPAHAPPAAAAAPSMPDDLSGNWVRDFKRGNFGIDSGDPDKPIALTDGQLIPLRPEFEKLYRSRLRMNQTTRPFAGTTSRCLPPGTPYNMMGPPYPIRIVQQPQFIAILLEEGWTFRAIYMNEQHPEQLIPSFMGHSTGHWDGKTLVIDTVGMREDTSLNGSGLPHSGKMVVTERLHRTDPDTLVDRVEINDPVDYTKPFTFESIFVRSPQKQMEYICEKNNIQVDAEGRQIYGHEK